ncbi:MAG: hypothetical protein NT007_16115 [Candidatus Kapabacteria bacterium]|nr:hypothetical protein [Candidatus Kapabacteria bacterium]
MKKLALVLMLMFMFSVLAYSQKDDANKGAANTGSVSKCSMHSDSSKCNTAHKGECSTMQCVDNDKCCASDKGSCDKHKMMCSQQMGHEERCETEREHSGCGHCVMATFAILGMILLVLLIIIFILIIIRLIRCKSCCHKHDCKSEEKEN